VSILVRPETPADHEAIREVHRLAFANHPFSHQTEHRIVDVLRAAGALALSLVAEQDGAVVGHVAFSPATIGGFACGWYVLGPVGMRPERQRGGIGSRLVQDGMRELREAGARGCVLVGDPAYYTRFGFRHDPALTMHGVPPEVILALSLEPPAPRGEIGHHRAFFVD
jgi:putative acetyltransferase